MVGPINFLCASSLDALIARQSTERYEEGEDQLTLEMIRKLSKALTVSIDELLFDEDERGPDDTLRAVRSAAAVRRRGTSDRAGLS